MTAFERILRAPKLRAPHIQVDAVPVWRILMPKAEQHIYYTIDEPADEVVIETVWGARRGKGPKL